MGEQEKWKQGTARQAAELRIQLAQMTAASQMLERCAWDPKSKGYLAAMNQSICRMLRLVGRMELCGRLGDEAPELNIAPVNLGGLAYDLGMRMAGLLERTGVALTVDCPEHLAAQADGELVRQLPLELTANGDSAVFIVEDNGPGVSPEKLPFLFDSGAEELPDWRKSGNGIAIARRIAVLHGGRLAPLCVPGRGLAVTVSLPLNRGVDDVLRCPPVEWDRGGFDDAVVGLSHLLPAKVFEPVEYES